MNKYTVELPIPHGMHHIAGIKDHRHKFWRAGIPYENYEWLRSAYSKSDANHHWDIMCDEEDLIMLCLLSGARIEKHIV
jgi:hypothetical protein